MWATRFRWVTAKTKQGQENGKGKGEVNYPRLSAQRTRVEPGAPATRGCWLRQVKTAELGGSFGTFVCHGEGHFVGGGAIHAGNGDVH